jgi:RNA polymerase sigma factor (sigma-70 family)
MSAAPLLALVRRLTPEAESVSDAELLNRFALQRDQAAFELLVWRHGALVWGVCRRMLGADWQAAEDACQATFVALATHAARIRNRQAVAAFLHRVAARVALDLIARRRPARSLPGADHEPADHAAGPDRVAVQREFQDLLDTGLNRLPDRLRVPFVLCELEGRSNAEAAALLGCPVGTIESRLTRARHRLRAWLTARGVSPTVALAAMPETVRSAMLRAAAPASVEPAVRALAERAVRSSLHGLLLVIATALCGVIAAVGVALAGGGTTPAVVTPRASTAAPAQRVDGEGIELPAGVVARLGSARLRQGGWVNDICFSRDGQWIASVGTDRAVRLWDGKTGKQVLVVRRPSGEFNRVAFTADSKVIVAAGYDKTTGGDLFRIDRLTGTVTARFSFPTRRPPLVRFSPDGTRLAAGTEDTKQLLLIDTATGAIIWAISLGTERPGGVALSADSKTVAVTTDTGKVRLFDGAGKPAGVLSGGKVSLNNVALSPDGRVVVAHDQARSELLAWDRTTAKLLWKDRNHAHYSLTFAPDGRTLAITGYGYVSSTVKAADGKAGQSFRGMVESHAAAFRPDSKVVAFGSIGGTISLFDTATGRAISPSADPPHAVRWLRFSPDGKTLFGWAGDWYAWTVADSKQRQVTNTGWNYGVPLSPDGKLTAQSVWYSGAIPAGSKDDGRRFEIRDAATGQIVHSYSSRGLRGMRWTGFSADGKTLVGATYDGHLAAWTLATGKELFRLPGHKAASSYQAFSADGRVLVTGAFGDSAEKFPVRVYDLVAGKELAKFHPGAWVVSVSVSADGKRVAAATSANTGGKPDIREVAVVWDVASGKELVRLPQHGEGGFVAVSPDGRTVAVACRWQSVVRVWEVASRSERFVFRHDGEITGLLFHPDGRTLAAASKEAPIYLWDVVGELAIAPPAWDADGAAELWDDLASTSAARAFTVMRRLRAHPDAAIRLLRVRAKLPAVPDAVTLKRLFADLDSTDFRTREKATESLASYGEAIQAALQTERDRTASVEVRTRLRRLLERLTVMTPERIRLIRVVEVVEAMGTPGAKALLETCARGGFGSTLAAEATAALGRRQ